MTGYLIVAAAAFVAGVILTWLYARRLLHRAEFALAGLGDRLSLKQYPERELARPQPGPTIRPPDPPRSTAPPPPPRPPRTRDPRG